MAQLVQMDFSTAAEFYDFFIDAFFRVFDRLLRLINNHHLHNRVIYKLFNRQKIIKLILLGLLKGVGEFLEITSNIINR